MRKNTEKLNNMLSVHNLPTALFSDKSAVASDSKPVPGAFFALLTNPNPSLLTKCTKNLFSSSLIHTIHTFSTNIIKKLFTSYLVHFKGKNSYAPSYPHYPHFFNVYHQLSTPVFPHWNFCIYVINFQISPKNTSISLDKKEMNQHGRAKLI